MGIKSKLYINKYQMKTFIKCKCAEKQQQMNLTKNWTETKIKMCPKASSIWTQ